MKFSKSITPLLFLFLISINVPLLFSQDFSYSIAIGGGPSNLVYEKVDPNWETQGVTTFTAAFQLQYKLSDTFFLSSGLKYAQICNEVKFKFVAVPPVAVPTPTGFNISQNYIFMPLKAGYTSAYILDFFVTGGLELGYLLSANQHTDYKYSDSGDENIADQLESFNVCLNGTFGHGFNLFSIHFLAEAGVSYGLTDVVPNSEVELHANSGASNWKTIEYYFLLGISL